MADRVWLSFPPQAAIVLDAMKPEPSFWLKLVVRIPYAWLVAFFLVPFLIVLKISLVADRDCGDRPICRFSISPPVGRAYEASSPACRSTITGFSAPMRSTSCLM